MAFKRIGEEIKRKKKKGGHWLSTYKLKEYEILFLLFLQLFIPIALLLPIISIGQTCQILQLLVKLTSKLFFTKPSEIDRSPSIGDNNSSDKDTDLHPFAKLKRFAPNRIFTVFDLTTERWMATPLRTNFYIRLRNQRSWMKSFMVWKEQNNDKINNNLWGWGKFLFSSSRKMYPTLKFL